MQELERAQRVVIVVAHPDDEVIGAGGLLPSLKEVTVIHTTDGSPRNPADAHANGFESLDEYAAARRRELGCVLALAGLDPDDAICLGFRDQESMTHLPELCEALRQQFARLNPDIVLTMPYEGGHPDHDSLAFAIQRVIPDRRRVFEMTSYHLRDGLFEAGVFLPDGNPGEVRELSAEDAALKTKMLACYKSQAAVLRDFSVGPERFRRAPRYDFSQPPHSGVLRYEQLGWGITGEQWRELAAQCP